MVLELLELGHGCTLQLHVIQPFQDEGGFFAIGRQQGIERILGLVKVDENSVFVRTIILRPFLK